MSDERIEILRMVRDGVLSVEEAERLLEVVGEEELVGVRVSAGTASSLEELSKGFAGVGRGVAGVSRTIATAVQSAVRTAFKEKEEEESSGQGVQIKAGDAITFTGTGSSGLLHLRSGEGDRLVLTGDYEVDLDAGAIGVICKQGDLVATVPATAGPITVRTRAQDVRLESLGGPVDVETMSGRVGLLASTEALSRIVTMSGEIEAEILPGFRGTVRAHAMSGQVDLAANAGQVRVRPGEASPRVAEVWVRGGGEEMLLQSASGNIAIRGAA